MKRSCLLLMKLHVHVNVVKVYSTVTTLHVHAFIKSPACFCLMSEILYSHKVHVTTIIQRQAPDLKKKTLVSQNISDHCQNYKSYMYIKLKED